MGFLVIASAIVIRAIVLETYYTLPQNVEYYFIIGIWLLVPFMLLLSVVVFLSLAALKKIKLAEQSFGFVFSLFGWALGGVAIASVIVIAITAYYSSSQGPFAIIFFDGPLGAGVGMIVGLVMWLLKIREENGR